MLDIIEIIFEILDTCIQWLKQLYKILSRPIHVDNNLDIYNNLIRRIGTEAI